MRVYQLKCSEMDIIWMLKSQRVQTIHNMQSLHTIAYTLYIRKVDMEMSLVSEPSVTRLDLFDMFIFYLFIFLREKKRESWSFCVLILHVCEQQVASGKRNVDRDREASWA